MGQTKPEPPSALCWLISRKKALALLLEGLASLPCLYIPIQPPVWELFLWMFLWKSHFLFFRLSLTQ